MNTSDTGQSRAFSPPELAFLIGVPLLWAVLLLFHPEGEGEQLYVDLQDNVTAFLVVHVGTMLFIPLMGITVYVLLRGVEGTAALMSRIAVVFFVIFYGAWEALYGIGNGILADEVNGLPQAQRAVGSDVIQGFGENFLIRNFGVFALIGTLGLIVATIAAGVALRRHGGAPVSVAALLGVSGLLITAHPPPFGPAGLVLFIAAVLLYVRSQARRTEPARLGVPLGST